MGALFELVAQLVIALGAVVLAQVTDGAAQARQEPPSVQRTLLQSARPAAPKETAQKAPCPEQARLHNA